MLRRNRPFVAVKLRDGTVKLHKARGPSMSAYLHGKKAARLSDSLAQPKGSNMSFYKHRQTGQEVKLLEQTADNRVIYQTQEGGEPITVPANVFFTEHGEMSNDEILASEKERILTLADPDSDETGEEFSGEKQANLENQRSKSGG